MIGIGLEVPDSGVARSHEQAEEIRERLGLPLIIRPSRTLGGTGGSIARDPAEYRAKVQWGMEMSPNHEVLIEQSVEGWKEFELEVMRDMADNVVIVCSIENFDPMGVHTGDSITVAPAQTLTDKEYQIMRDAALRIIREIGVDTGGSNIQFAIDPESGRMVVIEMNPRVSRSSALASKATGFPIAKIAARLAVGYRLDEIPNDITRMTPACFEPTIDYVVTKIPRFAFEKFRGAADELGPQMKSVGEAMAIGRTFKESLQKALRSLEIGSWGLESRTAGMRETAALATVRAHLSLPNSHRLYYLADAVRLGIAREEIHHAHRHRPLVYRRGRRNRRGRGANQAAVRSTRRCCARPRRAAFRIAESPSSAGLDEAAVALKRREAAVTPVFKAVDTCGAEFQAFTPYLYSTYEGEDEAPPDDRPKVMILGGGPNRIGQGIEFDYCCVHASLALKEAGFETIMVNCNPETVSTDYDISDRLYFEPLTFEDVMAIAERERPIGVIVQFGGQTPLKLAVPLERAGVPILGTSPDAIDRAEDRERFNVLVEKLGLQAAARRADARPGPGGSRRRGSRLPGADPAVLRARRTRDGSRRGRGGAAALRRAGAARFRRAPAAGRPLSAGRDRSRRRRDLRRRDRGDRRRDGTRRARRNPFGRQRLRFAAAHAERRDAGRIDAADADARARTRRRRPDQRAVRDFRGRGLHPGGQPARLAHHPVRQQGDRRAAGQAGRAGDGGQKARRSRFHAPSACRTTFRSRSRCFPSCAFPASTPSSAPR